MPYGDKGKMVINILHDSNYTFQVQQFKFIMRGCAQFKVEEINIEIIHI